MNINVHHSSAFIYLFVFNFVIGENASRNVPDGYKVGNFNIIEL